MQVELRSVPGEVHVVLLPRHGIFPGVRGSLLQQKHFSGYLFEGSQRRNFRLRLRSDCCLFQVYLSGLNKNFHATALGCGTNGRLVLVRAGVSWLRDRLTTCPPSL